MAQRRPGNGGNGNGGQGGGRGASGGNGDGDPGGDGGDGGDGDGGDITELVNAAVASHMGRKLPSILGPIVAKALESALGPIQEQIQALQGGGGAGAGGQGGQQQGAGQGGAGGQQQGGGAGGQPDPEVAKLQRQLADLNKKLAQQAEQTAAQEAEARNARRDAMLTDGLTKLGVDKHRMRGALAIARDAMVWDAEAQTATGGKGAWVWRAQRNGYHEDLTVDAGLGEWGKSEEGKSYIAPSPQLRGGGGAAGSQLQQRRVGQQQVPPDPNAQRQAQKSEAGNALWDQVSAMLGGGSVQLGTGQG